MHRVGIANPPNQPRSPCLPSRGGVRRLSIRAIAARCAGLAAPLALTACRPAILDPQGSVGQAEKMILIDSMAIMLAIVIPTIVATFLFAWWYRASNKKARYLPDWAYSGRIELVVWGIPALVVMLLGGVAWIGSHDLDPAKPLPSNSPPLEVQVVSLDWKWLFIYPNQRVASVNRLVIPAGAPVHFLLTSASVMNAFFIPQLGSMIYAMNGMTSELNLQADTPGAFHGLSSHYSGDGFSDMHFEALAVSDDKFGEWIGAARKDGPILNTESYAELAKQNVAPRPLTYRAVDGDIFQQIVSQELPPGPGPQAQESGAVSPKEH